MLFVILICFPFALIAFNIVPDVLKIVVITDYVVIIRPLPNVFNRIKVMYLF